MAKITELWHRCPACNQMHDMAPCQQALAVSRCDCCVAILTERGNRILAARKERAQ